MAEYRQPSISNLVTTVGGEVVLKKRVFGYVLVSDGTTNAEIKFYKGSSGGDQIWEDQIVGGDRAKAFNFAHEPLGDPETSADIACVVSGLGAVAYVRNH